MIGTGRRKRIPTSRWVILLVVCFIVVGSNHQLVSFLLSSSSSYDKRIQFDINSNNTSSTKRADQSIPLTTDPVNTAATVNPLTQGLNNTTYDLYSCKDDFEVPTKRLLDTIRVANLKSNFPKVLCFIMMHSQSDRIHDVLETWGKRCDKLVLASDTTDPILGTVAIKAKATYKGLWNKLIETLRYIWDHYQHEYEWFFKVDDDSYVIVENLKAFLASNEVQQHYNIASSSSSNHRQRQDSTSNASLPSPPPLIYGRRMAMEREILRDKIGDKPFLQKLIQRHPNHTNPFVFVGGGAGYVMNRAYLFALVQNFDHQSDTTPTTKRKCPEDVCQSATALYSNIVPQSSRDVSGRERFHFSNPLVMYDLQNQYPNKKSWVYRYHDQLGGISTGLECCSSDSISFHFMTRFKGYMQYVDQQLYACRGRNGVLTAQK